jgi:predicted O-methyltransferase YrrM
LGKVRELLYGNHDVYANVNLYPYNDFTWGIESDIDSFRMCMEESKPSLIVEVGSFLGGSAIRLAKLAEEMNLIVEIVCIDTWLGSIEHWSGDSCQLMHEHGRPMFYYEFLSNIVQSGFRDVITPFPIDSSNGLLLLKKYNISVDMIYLDGAHDFMSVKNDLYNAQNVLRPGGYLIGDDWHHPDIRRAVSQMFGMYFMRERGSKYLWVK